MNKKFIVLCVFFFVSSCSEEMSDTSSTSPSTNVIVGPTTSASIDTGVTLPQIEFTNIAHEDELLDGSFTEKQTRVLSSQAAFNEVAFKYTLNPPELDFEAGQVLLADLGQRPSVGHWISIKSITEFNSSLVADVVITIPGDTCVVFEKQVNPHHMIYIPSRLEIAVVEEVIHTDCVD